MAGGGKKIRFWSVVMPFYLWNAYFMLYKEIVDSVI